MITSYDLCYFETFFFLASINRVGPQCQQVRKEKIHQAEQTTEKSRNCFYNSTSVLGKMLREQVQKAGSMRSLLFSLPSHKSLGLQMTSFPLEPQTPETLTGWRAATLSFSMHVFVYSRKVRVDNNYMWHGAFFPPCLGLQRKIPFFSLPIHALKMVIFLALKSLMSQQRRYLESKTTVTGTTS